MKLVFIRFNPDQYTDCNDVQHHGIFDTNSEKRNTQEVRFRMNVLVEERKRHILRIEKEENSALLEIRNLFYNGYMVKKY